MRVHRRPAFVEEARRPDDGHARPTRRLDHHVDVPSGTDRRALPERAHPVGPGGHQAVDDLPDAVLEVEPQLRLAGQLAPVDDKVLVDEGDPEASTGRRRRARSARDRPSRSPPGARGR